MKLNVIITGVTGMVGEGVLHEALLHADVERVLVLTRRQSGMRHPKLTELVVNDFYDLSDMESQLAGYNACFFCLGVSSIGMKEADYRHITYDLTMSVARTLSKMNPDNDVLLYFRKSHRQQRAWATHVGARERQNRERSDEAALQDACLRFVRECCIPTQGMKNTLKYYKYFTWLNPLLQRTFPSSVSTLKELGLAMIHVGSKGYSKPVIEVKDIIAAAN